MLGPLFYATMRSACFVMTIHYTSMHRIHNEGEAITIRDRYKATYDTDDQDGLENFLLILDGETERAVRTLFYFDLIHGVNDEVRA